MNTITLEKKKTVWFADLY